MLSSANAWVTWWPIGSFWTMTRLMSWRSNSCQQRSKRQQPSPTLPPASGPLQRVLHSVLAANVTYVWKVGGTTNPPLGWKKMKEKPSTYLSTCATVFGPYHWPMDFPSPTPIWAASQEKKKKKNLAYSFTYTMPLPNQDLYSTVKKFHLETFLSHQKPHKRLESQC